MSAYAPHALLIRDALLPRNDVVSATVVADLGIMDGRRWATVSIGGTERRAFWPGNLPRQPVAGYGVKVQRMDARADSPLVVVLTLYQCGLVGIPAGALYDPGEVYLLDSDGGWLTEAA